MSEIYDALRRVQEQREGRAPLENGGGPTTATLLDETLQQAAAVLRFSEDIRRRMDDIGVDGISGVLNLYAQLRAAMDKVAQSEIDASSAELERVVDSMRTLHDELVRMKALKQTVEAIA